jgi:hypothetical protein
MVSGISVQPRMPASQPISFSPPITTLKVRNAFGLEQAASQFVYDQSQLVYE